MANDATIQRINVSGAKELLQRDGLLLLDARDHPSFSQARIGTALHLTSATLDNFLLRTPRQTPVLIYCYHGNASLTYGQMFIDFGFREVYSLDGGFEAWQAARARGAARVLDAGLQQWLTQHGYPAQDIDAPGEHGMTPLMRASKLGQTAIVAQLIQAGAHIGAKNIDGNNALWLACVGESLEAIDLLAHAGIAIDHQNDNGATCLMYAASTGKAAVVEKLLAIGADPTLKTLDDFSALDMAATIDCLRLLRRAEKELLQTAG
jgi:rhodanese-related sulfurtransferase